MKTLRLLAVLLVLAGPAWAANDEMPSAVADDWQKTVVLCVKAGGDQPICSLQHNPDETRARNSALKFMGICEDPKTREAPQCPLWRVYIKQRWGY